MSVFLPFLNDIRRYANLIEPDPSSRPFEGVVESATTIQVERGGVFSIAMRQPLELSNPDVSAQIDRVLEWAISGQIERLAVVDRAGHHRPVYRPFLIYCCLQAFAMAYETLPRSQFGRWEEGLRPWCDLLEGELADISWPTVHSMPAARGDAAAEAAWSALALHVAGKTYVRDAWIDLASDTFGKLARAQRESGAFLDACASDNPETHWYHELVLLHAAASYAVQAEDRLVASAVAQNAAYHLAETQPDHATSQPWAAFAFIWNPNTRSLADAMLHTAQTQKSSSDGTVSLMLLADALYCLKLFL